MEEIYKITLVKDREYMEKIEVHEIELFELEQGFSLVGYFMKNCIKSNTSTMSLVISDTKYPTPLIINFDT